MSALTEGFTKWRTAVAVMLCLALGMGLVGAYGFYVQAAADEFDKSIATINLGLALLLLASAFANPVIGWLADRYPIRPLLIAGGFTASGGLFAMSLATDFTAFVAAYLLLALGIILYGPVLTNLLVIRSYREHRARALAIAAIGVSLAAIFVPPIAAHTIELFEWRGSLQALALLVLLLVPLGLFILVVEPPPVEPQQNEGESAGSQYFKSRSFWILGLATGMILALASLLAVILVPHLRDTGMAATQAAYLMSVMGLAGLCGKLSMATLSSWLSGREKIVAALLAVCQCLSWYIFFTGPGMGGLIVAAGLAGFASGLYVPLLPYMTSLYFPESVLGRVNGLHMAMILPFATLGPWLAGRQYDVTGSYQSVFAALIAVSVLYGVGFLCLPRPAQKQGI